MDRIALVIGNSKYQNVTSLNNPGNDANDISDILSKLGFSVRKHLDLSIDEMIKVTREFAVGLNEFSAGLFYYAGHGMQINGSNYLVPIDCSIDTKEKTILSCFDVNSFLAQLEVHKGKTNICILDACRNNPFAMSRDISAGFAPFSNQPRGSIIAFSTSADDTASDGNGSNGLYTSALKETLLIPNLKIEDVFKSTRIKVLELSNGEQVSWEHSCLIGDFYFSVKEIPVSLEVEDNTIFEFINERSLYYESITDDIKDIECMPYVDAYKKFNISIIKIVRAFSRVNFKKNGQYFNDSTIDEINVGYLESWGFYRKNGRWYYGDNYVEFGDPLPLPKELLPLSPIEGCEVEITGDLKCELFDNKILFHLVTTLPSETPVIFSLRGKGYHAQYKGIVENGNITTDGFSNKGNKINDGLYKVSITCPIYSVLPTSVKEILGERNRNMVGTNIKYSPISGNTAELNYNLMIKDDEIFIV